MHNWRSPNSRQSSRRTNAKGVPAGRLRMPLIVIARLVRSDPIQAYAATGPPDEPWDDAEGPSQIAAVTFERRVSWRSLREETKCFSFARVLAAGEAL